MVARLLGLATFGRLGRRAEADSPGAPHFAELAEAYRCKDLLEEAKDVCEQGLREWPSYVSGHIVLAKVYRDAGALDRAETSLHKALQLDPMNAVALGLMGDIALRRSQWDEAIRYLEDALFLCPVDAHTAELLKMARQRTRPIVVTPPATTETQPDPVAESPPAAPPAPEPAPAAPERAPATDVERQISALRQMPGIEGALLLTSEGLPVSGSLGEGNEADEEIAALAASVVGEWARSDQLPPARPRGAAVVEAEAGQLVLATADGWILLVSVSGHIRLGRVLGSIRGAVEAIGGARN